MIDKKQTKKYQNLDLIKIYNICIYNGYIIPVIMLVVLIFIE